MKRLALAAVLSATGCADEPLPPDPAKPILKPCEAATLAGAPVVALEWDRMVETHLAPGASPAHLALDYLVSPGHAVDQVHITPDFDPALDATAQQIDGTCPRQVDYALLAELADEDVVSAVITVAHSETAIIRRGRVTAAFGSGTLEIDTSDLVGEPGWWFLFEPGRGSSRLVIVPVEPASASLAITGMPAISAVIALVRSDEILWDAVNQVAYTPPGFSATWRSRVTAWRGMVLTDWNDDEPRVLPSLLASLPGGIPSLPLSAGAELDAEQTIALLQTSESTATGTLVIPCASEVEIIGTGFVDLTIDDGAAVTELPPGVGLVVEVACTAGSTADVSVSATSMNGRAGHVLARLVEE